MSTAAIAVEHVIPAIQQTPGCAVVAVASRTEKRAAAVARQFGILRHYDSYADLLVDPDVDCVYLALPNSMHAEWAIRCAEAGKAVLCEKPMTLSLHDARRVVRAAEQCGVLLTEAFMYRYHSQFRWLRDLVHDGAVGEVRAIRGSIGFLIGPPPNIRLEPDLGGGALLDVGCYPLDAMCLLFDAAPTSAEAIAFQAGGIDHTCSAVLTFPGDRLGVMDATFGLPWLQAPLEIAGTEGVARLDDAYNPGMRPCRATLTRRRGEPERVDFPGMNMYQAMVEAFSRSYSTGGAAEFSPAASVATATASDLVRQAFEARSSARVGGFVGSAGE
ncbi:Gfo/Idh/MocA family oxidoreductase [Micromonospora sp. C51]|uniref:Gfo/Idh/MocA family protein n=1 Tax=Micromonospora sp. C51 TaxID=2824879 RepID=UPI001B35A3C6|nr:Gfo/Idh/MocA family oxidoreductase [Micromonospora sp. C51]MBQ1053072.1 Gfo/Idh/MocA family oxidoreductase [Micromonospora sp. C51]